LRVGEVSEDNAPERIRALFRDGVDDRAGRTAELGVVLIRQDLELLNRFERRSRLATDAAAQRIVGVVAAVESDVVALSRLATCNDGVVAELVRWQKLNTW